MSDNLSDRFSNKSDRSNFSQSLSDGLALLRTLQIKKNICKFENVRHDDLVLVGFLGLVPMHICVKFEGSMINHTDRRSKYNKNEKWPWSNGPHIYCAYMQDVNFLWSNLWPGGLSTEDNNGNASNSWLGRFFGIYAKWANWNDTSVVSIVFRYF